MRELAALHRVYMRDELGSSWVDRQRTHPDGSPVEACGAPISATMVRELRSLDLAQQPVTADHVTVVSTRPRADVARFRELWPQAAWHEVTDTTGWNSDAALNAMVVPMQVVQVVIQQLERTSP